MKFSLGLLCLLLFAGYCQGQIDLRFIAPTGLNPAFNGSIVSPRAFLGSRNQYPSLDGGSQSVQLTYDQQAPALKSGFGARAFYSASPERILESSGYYLGYSYHGKVAKKFKLALGAEVGLLRKSLDWSKLTFGDQIDPVFGFIYPTLEEIGNDHVNVFDLNVGLLFYSEKFHVGLSADHLNEPNESFFDDEESRLPRKWTLHGAYTLALRWPKAFVQFYGQYQVQQPFDNLNLGAMLHYGKVYGGVFVDPSNSVTMLAGIEFLKHYRINYSYGLSTNELSSANTGGTHEVLLSMALKRG